MMKVDEKQATTKSTWTYGISFQMDSPGVFGLLGTNGAGGLAAF